MIETLQIADLHELDRRLIARALEASANAYAPYSKFSVGAAVRSHSNAIFHGANLENASYGVTFCAEVAAITAANSEGSGAIEAIAVVGFSLADQPGPPTFVTPCGRCRQLIIEMAQASNKDIKVISCSSDLRHAKIARISELLPEPFGPANLGIVGDWSKGYNNRKKKILALSKRLISPIQPNRTTGEIGGRGRFLADRRLKIS